MNQPAKKGLGDMVKTARTGKGYTQQELSDLTGISLRSIQRIESEAVVPRSYTLRILATQLGIKDATSVAQQAAPDDIHAAMPVPSLEERSLRLSKRLSTARKFILSAGAGVLLILGGLAFLIQAPAFPETHFEALLFWMGVAGAYTLILYRLWH